MSLKDQTTFGANRKRTLADFALLFCPLREANDLDQ